jgi:hypothetical protein
MTLPTIDSTLDDLLFELAEEALGELGSRISNWNCDFNAHSCLETETSTWREQDRKRLSMVSANPQAILQRSGRHRIADVDVVILKRSNIDVSAGRRASGQR